MIACQRDKFDLPEDVSYLNCAYTAPLLRTAAQAGNEGIKAKSNPATITSSHFFSTVEENRNLFADLIAANPNDVAIIPAVSYGIALAAKNLPVAKGQNIVILEDQFPSHVYSWRRLAAESGAVIKTVRRPSNQDWTSAILEAIDADTAIAALPNCHWTDGTIIDLNQVGIECRRFGTALVVDGTQSVGAMPFSVETIQPDFLVTTAHKWLLGPYSYGFCYVAQKRQTGVPLEENWMNREGSEDFSRLVDYRDTYQPGSRRYDVGEASNFILAPIAAAAIRQILEWGVENIAATLRQMTDAIAERSKQMGLGVAPPAVRAPHLIGVSKPGGFARELPELLAQEKVHVSVRGESIRISPHLYNTSEDLNRLFHTLEKVI
jgi:selenocysteine lyase/cysteine desulfurase